jgi:hypothetical protein
MMNFFIIENGTAIGWEKIVPLKSFGVNEEIFANEELWIVLSKSCKCVCIIDNGKLHHHLTAYCPTRYWKYVEKVIDFRNHCIGSIFLCERMRGVDGNSHHFSTWQILNHAKKFDENGWDILAEDENGCHLCICPLRKLLRLNWIIEVHNQYSLFLKCISFEYYETLEFFHDHNFSPVLYLLRFLFKTSSIDPKTVRCINVPYLQHFDCMENDNEYKELENIIPWLHALISSNLQGNLKKPFGIIAQKDEKMNILYATSTSLNQTNKHLTKEFLYYLYPQLQIDKSSKNTAYAICWLTPGIDCTSLFLSETTKIQYFIIEIFEDYIQLECTIMSTQDHGNLDNKTHQVFVIMKSLLLSLIMTSNFQYDILDKSKENDHQAIITSDLELFCRVFREFPILISTLFYSRSLIANNNNYDMISRNQELNNLDIQVIEGRDRVRFTIFSHTVYDDQQISIIKRPFRLRGFFRLQNIILDYNCQTEIFTLTLTDGSIKTFTFEDYQNMREIMTSRWDVGDRSFEMSEILPIRDLSLSMIEQLLACLRSITSTSNSSQTNNYDFDDEQRRIEHEQQLITLCRNVIMNSDIQQAKLRVYKGLPAEVAQEITQHEPPSSCSDQTNSSATQIVSVSDRLQIMERVRSVLESNHRIEQKNREFLTSYSQKLNT